MLFRSLYNRPLMKGGARNGDMAVSCLLRPHTGSLRGVSERLDSASVSAVALRLTGHDHRVTGCLLAVPDLHAVVHGLLSTSTYGAYKSVREILAGAGCWQLLN